ncbi:MAG: macro domain-containing protein [Nitrospirae bacterium]|nr:macro domain-containing protein [Nitrospirota bacterium]
MEIEIYFGDIFICQADAIVNPANIQTSLNFGSHISQKIKKNGGSLVINERKQKGTINLGDAVYTSGGNLHFRYIIHAAILDMYDFNPLFLLKIRYRTSGEVLRNATLNSLIVASELKIKSIVFSLMGSGIGGMPIKKCAEIMLNEIISYFNINKGTILNKVIFAIKNKHDYRIVCEIKENLKKLVSQHS